MTETQRRRQRVLQLVPRAPRGIDAARLLAELQAQGTRTALRTVQRDLILLSSAFPLTVDESRRPHQWRWAEDAVTSVLPPVDVSTAAALTLVERTMRPVMPAVVLDRFAPYIDAASKTVARSAAQRRRRLAGPIGYWTFQRPCR